MLTTNGAQQTLRRAMFVSVALCLVMEASWKGLINEWVMLRQSFVQSLLAADFEIEFLLFGGYTKILVILKRQKSDI